MVVTFKIPQFVTKPDLRKKKKKNSVQLCLKSCCLARMKVLVIFPRDELKKVNAVRLHKLTSGIVETRPP